jgi:hypothetical protein
VHTDKHRTCVWSRRVMRVIRVISVMRVIERCVIQALAVQHVSGVGPADRPANTPTNTPNQTASQTASQTEQAELIDRLQAQLAQAERDVADRDRKLAERATPDPAAPRPQPTQAVGAVVPSPGASV